METLFKITVLTVLISMSLAAQTINGDADFWIARGGCWQLSDTLITARGHWESCKLYSKKSYKDFIFEVGLAKTGESGPFCVLFRYDEEKDGGYIILCFPLGNIHFSKIEKHIDSYIFMGATTYWKIGMNQWNVVRIEATGSQFEIFINGEHVLTQQGSEYVGGKIGFIVKGDPRQSANFRVLKLEEK